MSSLRKEPGDILCEKFLCLCLPGVSLCPLVCPCWALWLQSPFPSADYGLQHSPGSTPRKPPQFLFLPQLLSPCWEHLQAAKTTAGRAAGDQTGPPSISWLPALALGLTQAGAAPGWGSPSPGREQEGEAQPTCLCWSSREPFQHTLLWL